MLSFILFTLVLPHLTLLNLLLFCWFLLMAAFLVYCIFILFCSNNNFVHSICFWYLLHYWCLILFLNNPCLFNCTFFCICSHSCFTYLVLCITSCLKIINWCFLSFFYFVFIFYYSHTLSVCFFFLIKRTKRYMGCHTLTLWRRPAGADNEFVWYHAFKLM